MTIGRHWDPIRNQCLRSMLTCLKFLNDREVHKMLDEAPALSSIKLPASEYGVVF